MASKTATRPVAGPSRNAAIRPTIIDGPGSASNVALEMETRLGTIAATSSPNTNASRLIMPFAKNDMKRSNQVAAAEGLGAGADGCDAGATTTWLPTPDSERPGALR